jgi:DNA replication and repair protein RecF
MLRILTGAPDERRRYLNLVLRQVQNHYTAVLSDYAKVITQRNALLKQLAERQGDIDRLIIGTTCSPVPGRRSSEAHRAVQI